MSLVVDAPWETSAGADTDASNCDWMHDVEFDVCRLGLLPLVHPRAAAHLAAPLCRELCGSSVTRDAPGCGLRRRAPLS